MERSVSVPSDRNIRDHLSSWRLSTYFGWNISIEIRSSNFDKPVLCPVLGNSEKRWKEATAIPISWPGLIGKCRSIFLGRSVARIFQRGRGGVTRCQNEVYRQIFMSFLPPVVGCLLKTWLTRGGGGHGHPKTPLGYAPARVFPVISDRSVWHNGRHLKFTCKAM